MAIFWRTVWCEVKVPALTGISFPTWFFCWNLCSHIGSFSCLATRWARGIQSSFVLLCISVHISTASSWYMVSFSHSPSSVLPPPLLFFFHRGSRWRLLLVIFPFIKDLLDILSSGSVWGKCDLARKMTVELPLDKYNLEQCLLLFVFVTAEQVSIRVSPHKKRMTFCGPGDGICSCLIKKTQKKNKPQTFLWVPLLLQHCALFSSSNLLLVLLPPSHLLSPSTALSHPGGPSFQHHCPSPAHHLVPPVCKAGVSQDKEDSDYLTKKATGSWGQKYTPIHTLNVCILLLCLYFARSRSTCICTSHIWAPFLSLTLSHTPAHAHGRTHLLWAGLCWDWGQGELELSVCH